MIIENYFNILNGLDVKENLLIIKDALKDPIKGSREKDALLLKLDGDFSVFTGLLDNEDPKIRKNSAIVLGTLGFKESLDALFKAYMSDATLYNKAAYLEAIRKIGCEPYTGELKKRFDELRDMNLNDDNKRHILEEMKVFKKIFGTGKPEFIGYDLQNEVILTTLRDLIYITEGFLKDERYKKTGMGVVVKTKDLRKILPIRTYEEILFIPDSVRTVEKDPVSAAKKMYDAGITGYIFDRIGIVGASKDDKKNFRVNFRTETKMKDRDEGTGFSKKFSSELEALTHWDLSNSVSDYDLEFRFIENSNGTMNVLLKFMILKDVRFTYRKESIAAGMKPYLAANLMQLASPYMAPNCAVLDPFCGAGTLIAEHEPVTNARLYYGIDIFGEAVEKAKVNLKSAGLMRKTELINKDFFKFEHAHHFDEIIADMPYVTEKKTTQDIEEIYRSFFEKCQELFEKHGILILYSRNPEFVHEYCVPGSYSIDEEIPVLSKTGSSLFVISYRRQ